MVQLIQGRGPARVSVCACVPVCMRACESVCWVSELSDINAEEKVGSQAGKNLHKRNRGLKPRCYTSENLVRKVVGLESKIRKSWSQNSMF